MDYRAFEKTYNINVLILGKKNALRLCQGPENFFFQRHRTPKAKDYRQELVIKRVEQERGIERKKNISSTAHLCD
jgi:hypothetical protein